MVKNSVKTIIGLFFIISAILKLINIDNFEIYIFGLEIFSLNSSILISRLIIGLELFLGIMLCINIFKPTIHISISVTFVFSVFLLHRVIIGDAENCQCLGYTIYMTPFQSILKNILILIGLFWVLDSNYFCVKHSKVITIVVVLFSIATPNIASPPDFLYYKQYADYATYNSANFNDFVISSLHETQDEKVILCFLSTNCKYCKLTAKKISTITQKHKINTENVLYVFIDSSDIVEFMENTASSNIQYIQIPRKTLLRITQGMVPLIILYENKVLDSFIYRNIEERKIIDFIGENKAD